MKFVLISVEEFKPTKISIALSLKHQKLPVIENLKVGHHITLP